MTDAAVERARAYYRALDDHDYEALADLLAPGFVHDRPDLTLEGRERFVAFMREERPQKDTTHRVDAVYRVAGGESGSSGRGDGDGPEDDGVCGASGDGVCGTSDDGDDLPTDVAARGRLLTADGERIADFVDVFAVVDGDVARIETYTR